MKKWFPLPILALLAIVARGDEIDDFAAGNKQVNVYVTRDGKLFHGKNCRERSGDETLSDLGDVLAQHPEMCPCVRLDTIRFREVAPLFAEIMIKSIQEKLDAREKLLQLLKKTATPINKGKKSNIESAYHSYMKSCLGLHLRQPDEAFVELLKNALPGTGDKPSADVTPRQSAAMKDLFVTAVQQGIRDTKLSRTDVIQELLIAGLSDYTEKDRDQIRRLRNRYEKFD